MRLSLKLDLMLRTGALLVFVLIVNAIFNGFNFYDEFKKRIQVQADAIGNDIVNEVHQSLSVLQADEQIFAMFNYNLERLLKERDYLIETAIFSPQGKYLSNGRPDLVGTDVPPDVMKRVASGDIGKEPFPRRESYSVVLPIAGSDGKTAVYLLLGFKKDEFNESMTKIIGTLLALLLGSIIVMAIATNIFAVGTLTAPINRLATQAQVVSSGDLTHEAPLEGAVEIQTLAKAFNNMLKSLQEIIIKISHASSQFTETCQKLFMLSGEITHGSRLQSQSLNEASDSVKKMENNVEEIANKVLELNHLSQNTSASILEMAASISEVDNNVDHLAGMVDEISSSILQITQSAKEVATSVENLAREAEAAATSISEINSSLNEVDSNTTLSANLSTQVAEVAEEGMRSIEGAQEGMRAIRIAVETTADSINKLGERSTRIGKILGVINKIAEETNLLALNAAIIAAEAGEHGRGFNVVANEIQTLAERTTLQTKEIDTLIRDVQRETQQSVQQAKNVLKRVEEGENLTSGTARVLEKIKESSNASRNMIQQIAKATQEQTLGLRRVAEASDKFSLEVKQISKATREQAAGTSKIMEAIERIKDLSRSVQSATREQAEGSKTISRATEQVREFASNINNLIEGHRTDAANVASIVARNLKVIEENMQRVQNMENGIEGLIQLTTSLNEEIGKFQISAQRRRS